MERQFPSPLVRQPHLTERLTMARRSPSRCPGVAFAAPTPIGTASSTGLLRTCCVLPVAFRCAPLAASRGSPPRRQMPRVTPSATSRSKATSGATQAFSPVVLLGRAAFVVTFTISLASCWLICRVIHLTRLGGSRRVREGWCIATFAWCVRWITFAPCFWMRLHGVDDMRAALEEAAKESGGAPFILANHNSKLDSIALSAFMPTNVSYNLRSLVKAALLDEPMFGEYVDSF